MATTNRLRDQPWDDKGIYIDVCGINENEAEAIAQLLRQTRDVDPATLYGKPVYVDGQWTTPQEFCDGVRTVEERRSRQQSLPSALGRLSAALRPKAGNRKARRTAKAWATKERKR